MMMNNSQEQFASPLNKFLKHIVGSPLYKSGSAAATAAVVASAVGVVVAAIAIEQQQDDNDEQQPGAVDVTAKKISQAHTS